VSFWLTNNPPADELTNSMMYVPDSALVQEEEGESRKNSVSYDAERAPPPPPPACHLAIATHKVSPFIPNALERDSGITTNPLCFGRHVKPLVPAAFAVASIHSSFKEG
jgi:hypothetical protein